jgi:hypothetical protein
MQHFLGCCPCDEPLGLVVAHFHLETSRFLHLLSFPRWSCTQVKVMTFSPTWKKGQYSHWHFQVLLEVPQLFHVLHQNFKFIFGTISYSSMLLLQDQNKCCDKANHIIRLGRSRLKVHKQTQLFLIYKWMISILE